MVLCFLVCFFNNLKLTRCLTIWPALGQSWEDSPGGDQQPRQQMTGLRDNGDDKDKDNDQSLNHKKFSNVNHEKGPRGSKVLERCDIVSTSEIKAGKEQLDHEC